jgi:hypothetical protein
LPKKKKMKKKEEEEEEGRYQGGKRSNMRIIK